MNGNVARLLLIGPTVVVLLLALLATTALLAGALGRPERLAVRAAQVTERLSRGRALLFLWGLAALLLTFLAAAVLLNIKPLALLGLLVLLAGLTLAGFGLACSAARCGRALAALSGHPTASPLLRLAVGLTTLFLAAFLPIVGWGIVSAAILTGLGATLDVLLRRQ